MGNEDKEILKVDMDASGIKRVTMDFPSNAHSAKQRPTEEPKEEPKKVQKVVKGPVVKKKKSLGKRFAETFLGEDISDVGSYIIHDILIPAAKSAINDMVQGGIEMVLFGERRTARTSRDRDRSRVSYSSYYSNDRRDDRDRRDISYRDRARHNFDEIILSSRGEAKEVLDRLVDLTIDYGQATISDFYDLVGITGNFTDDKYGWTDLRSSSVSRVRDGYMINLPKAILLD
jgi:hypothetical protein